MEFLGLGIATGTCFLTVLLFLQLFWLWMLVECLLKEPSTGHDKIVWGLVIFFMNLLGAVIYFVFRRPQRIEAFGE